MQLTDKQAYTVGEVAELMGFSRRWVIRTFEKEKRVLIQVRPETMHKRRYRNIRCRAPCLSG